MARKIVPAATNAHGSPTVIHDIPGKEVSERALYAAPGKPSAIMCDQFVAFVLLSEPNARMTTSLTRIIPRKNSLLLIHGACIAYTLELIFDQLRPWHFRDPSSAW